MAITYQVRVLLVVTVTIGIQGVNSNGILSTSNGPFERPCLNKTDNLDCGELTETTTYPIIHGDDPELYLSIPGYDLTPEDIEIYLSLPVIREYLDSLSDEFRRLLVTETLRSCPFLNLCNISLGLVPPITGYPMEPCCKQCQCTPDCVRYGSCCPDYPGLKLDNMVRSHDTAILETCMKTYIRHDLEVKSSMDNEIKAIQSCPLETVESLYFRCSGEFEFFESITLDDIVPLSDNVTMTTYRNKHCAICNGANVETLSKWDVQLDCQFPPKVSSASELLQIVLHGSDAMCGIQLHYPLYINPTDCSGVVTKCNVSGQWEKYDVTIKRACSTYQAEITVWTNPTSVTYRNPFCALCNGRHPVEFMCPYPDNNEPSNPYSFSGLLSSKTFRGPPKTGVTTCGDRSMYDEVTKQCRDVKCAYHRIFRNGECELFLETSNTMGYNFGCQLQSATDMSITDVYKVLPLLRQQLENYITSTFVGGVCACFTRIVTKKDVNSSGNDAGLTFESVELRYDIATAFSHNIENFVQHLLNLDGMDVNITTYLNQTVVFKLYLKDDTSDYTHIPYALFYNWSMTGDEPVELSHLMNLSFVENGKVIIPYFKWNEDPNICYFDGIFHKLLDLRQCQMLKINTSEFGLTETPHGLKSEQGKEVTIGLFEYSINGTSMITLCVETFNRAFHPYINDNKSHGLSPELIVSILSVSVSIACLLISLFTYCWIPQIQTLPGKNNMALIVSLLLAQSLYLFSSYGSLDTESLSCKLIGGFTHFFWLLSVFWMNVCTFHMFRVLLQVRATSRPSSKKKHIRYHIYSILASAVFVTVNIVVTMVHSEYTDFGYGNGRCYISTQRMVEVTFGIPAAVVVLANLSMFLAIIIHLKRAPSVSKNVKHERNYFIVFAKLSTVTGITWLFGFVYMWTDIVVFSYLFIVLNGSQGLFMMISFVCNARTFAMFKDRNAKMYTSSFVQSNSTKATSINNTDSTR